MANKQESYKKHKDKGAYFHTAQSKSGVKWFGQADSRVGVLFSAYQTKRSFVFRMACGKYINRTQATVFIESSSILY